jgi:hypothetical protein
VRARRAIVLGLLLAAASLAWAGPARAASPVARVNGELIERATLDRAFTAHAASRGRNVGSIRSPEAYRRLLREALDLLVDEALLAQEAVRRGHQPSEAEVAQALADLRAGLKGPAAFEIMLEQDRLTEAAFAARLGRQLAVERLVRRDLAAGLEAQGDAARLAAVRACVDGLRRTASIEILIRLEAGP